MKLNGEKFGGWNSFPISLEWFWSVPITSQRNGRVEELKYPLSDHPWWFLTLYHQEIYWKTFDPWALVWKLAIGFRETAFFGSTHNFIWFQSQAWSNSEFNLKELSFTAVVHVLTVVWISSSKLWLPNFFSSHFQRLVGFNSFLKPPNLYVKLVCYSPKHLYHRSTTMRPRLNFFPTHFIMGVEGIYFHKPLVFWGNSENNSGRERV